MYVAVLETCRRHETEWSSNPKFASAVGDLETALNEINAVALSQSIKTLGISSYKTQKLGYLYAALEEVHSAFRALASETDDPGLMVRNDFPPSTFRRMNMVRLKTHIAGVGEDLISAGNTLEPYGIDSTRLGEILQLIDESTIIISTPRSAIIERKTLTKTLDTKTAGIDRLIKDRMDNIVRLLKRSLPEFFDEYFNARLIIQNGVRKSNTTNLPNDPAPPELGDPF